MAFEQQQLCVSLTAGEDLSAAQYKFVTLSAANTVILPTAETDIPIGVLQNDPISGAAAAVCVLGVTKVQGDANLAFAAQVGTSADGQAAAYTVLSTTYQIVGEVLDDNVAADGLATIMFRGAHRSRIA